MPRLSGRWERELRRVHAAARRLGLSSPEADRLVRDARKSISDALLAGLRPGDVHLALTGDGVGSVALFVGDAASVAAAASDRLSPLPSVALH